MKPRHFRREHFAAIEAIGNGVSLELSGRGLRNLVRAGVVAGQLVRHQRTGQVAVEAIVLAKGSELLAHSKHVGWRTARRRRRL